MTEDTSGTCSKADSGHCRPFSNCRRTKHTGFTVRSIP